MNTGKSTLHYLISFELPNSGQGGLGTYLQQCILQAEETKHRVAIFCLDETLKPGQLIESQYTPNSRIIRFNPSDQQHFAYLGKWAAASYSCARLIIDAIKRDSTSPLFIEVCDGFGLGYYLLQEKLTGNDILRDIPIVVTAHTPISLINQWSQQSNYRLPDYWIGEMERFCLTAADYVISPSQYLADSLLRDWQLKARKIDIIRNPYHISAINPSIPEDLSSVVESRDDSSGSQKHYIAASRVHHFKGIPELLEGFAMYWENGGASTLSVYGADTLSEVYNESLTEVLKRKYKKHIDENRLKFHGAVSYSFLSENRFRYDALFHPSLHENLPYTVIEHMAGGGLVAASSKGGQAELISDTKNGFLFDPTDPADITRCIHLLDTLSPDQHREIGQAAKQTVISECDPATTWSAVSNPKCNSPAIG